MGKERNIDLGRSSKSYLGMLVPCWASSCHDTLLWQR